MSDKFENYEEPSISDVTGKEVTSEDSNVELTVTYDQGIETTQETKTITRTIKYVDAIDETKEIAPAVTQTATLTRTNVRNKVTGKVTEGVWSEENWSEQESPTIPNYEKPNIEKVGTALVTSMSKNTEILVKYPQATESVTEEKIITRTIKYVDATDEKTEVANPIVQKVKLTRINVRNKVTGKVTEGVWSEGTWLEQTSPTIQNYEKPNIEKVGTVVVTSTSKNTEILIKYPQATEDIKEEKIITRTIKYLEKGTNKVLKKEVQQKVTLIRINTVNKVTKAVTNGKWSKGSWKAVKAETIENYKDPTPAVVEKVEVNSTTEDEVINVYYEPKDTPPSITEPEPKQSPSPAPAPIPKPKPVPVPIPNPSPVPAPDPKPKPSPSPETKLTPRLTKVTVVGENQQKNKLANTGLESDSIRIYGLMLLGVSLVMIKQRKYIK